MRLDRELGTLNREIVAIKEKWKIALNIDSKKVAIEKLITRRKKLRDTSKVLKMVEDATKEEKERFSQSISSPPEPEIRTETKSSFQAKTDDYEIDETIFDDEKIPQPKIVKKVPEISKSESSIDKKPDHLTVSWLKNRLRSR